MQPKSIAREVGAEVVEVDLRYPSGSWQLDSVIVQILTNFQ